MIGKIRNFNTDRGFGFVRLVEARVDYLFLRSSLIDDALPGDTVQFWLEDNPRRAGELCAVDVKKIDFTDYPIIPPIEWRY